MLKAQILFFFFNSFSETGIKENRRLRTFLRRVKCMIDRRRGKFFCRALSQQCLVNEKILYSFLQIYELALH